MLKAGLGFTIHDSHIDAITAAPGWSVEHIKTTPKDIFQKREFIQTSHLHLGKHTRSTGLMTRGTSPPGMIALAIPVYAASNPRFCGQELSPDRVFVGQAGIEFESVGSSTFQVFFIALEADTFHRHATTLWATDWTPKLPIVRLQFINSLHRDRCIKTLSQVVEFGLRHPHHLADPAIALLLEDDSLDALLGSTGLDPIRPKETPCRRYQALRHAVNHIRERIDTPVTLRQLCKVTGVSDKALEIAFKETFDLTPKAYIRRIFPCPFRISH